MKLSKVTQLYLETEMKPLKLYRPMGISASTDAIHDSLVGAPLDAARFIEKQALDLNRATYASDEPLVKNICRWCRNVLLAGRRYDLKVEAGAIYQLASQSPFRQKYGVHVSNIQLLREILANAKKVAGSVSSTDADTKNYAPVFGSLILTRHISYAPHRLGVAGFKTANRRRFVISDTYRLDVFSDKSAPLSVRSTEVTPLYLHTDAHRPDDATDYFPQADDLVVNWHELATILAVDATRLYVAACCDAAGFQRPATVNGIQGTSERAYNPSGFSPEVLPGRPVTGGVDFNQIQPWDMVQGTLVAIAEAFIRPIPYNDWAGYDIANDVPLSDLLTNYPTATQEVRFRWRFLRMPDRSGVFPRPRLVPGSAAEIAITKFLTDQSGGAASYAGGGLFVLKAPGMTKLAAGTGNWGSPESITLIVEKLGAGGGSTAGGAASDAYGAKLLFDSWDDLGDARRTRDHLQDACVSKPTTSDCLECYSNVLGTFKSAKKTAISGAIAGAGGAAGGVLGICAATGPAGWIAGAVVVVVGIVVITVGAMLATDADREIDQTEFDCTRGPGQG